jgi:hypothetical protein
MIRPDLNGKVDEGKPRRSPCLQDKGHGGCRGRPPTRYFVVSRACAAALKVDSTPGVDEAPRRLVLEPVLDTL